MSIKTVLRLGDPRLRLVAEPVTQFDTPELHSLIADLLDTMADYDGAGLAAPQIGINLRVVIFGVERNPRYPLAEPFPETILINPVITPLSDIKTSAWEGCLSVPGMRGAVSRHSHIHYRGFDQFGQVIDRTADQFHARVVQHECDHLDGVLYPDKLVDPLQFGFIDELTASGILTTLPAE